MAFVEFEPGMGNIAQFYAPNEQSPGSFLLISFLMTRRVVKTLLHGILVLCKNGVLSAMTSQRMIERCTSYAFNQFFVAFIISYKLTFSALLH